MKTKILDDILDVVSSVCEVPGETIRSKCKRNDVVDARCIFVYYCVKFGFQTATIAEYLGRSRACTITDYLSNYDVFSKQSLSFRLMCHDVNRMLADKYKETAL